MELIDKALLLTFVMVKVSGDDVIFNSCSPKSWDIGFTVISTGGPVI
jgi:hypothetical protein